MELMMLAKGKRYFKKLKTETILLKLSSEMIGGYLWFIKFSNVLLKLVQ